MHKRFTFPTEQIGNLLDSSYDYLNSSSTGSDPANMSKYQ